MCVQVVAVAAFDDGVWDAAVGSHGALRGEGDGCCRCVGRCVIVVVIVIGRYNRRRAFMMTTLLRATFRVTAHSRRCHARRLGKAHMRVAGRAWEDGTDDIAAFAFVGNVAAEALERGETIHEVDGW